MLISSACKTQSGVLTADSWSRSDGQVVEILTDALTLPETPIGAKVARLLLVSDLLHNTMARVRNASRYRNLLEASLPDIFESLQVRHAAPVLWDGPTSHSLVTQAGLAPDIPLQGVGCAGERALLAWLRWQEGEGWPTPGMGRLRLSHVCSDSRAQYLECHHNVASQHPLSSLVPIVP